MTTMLVREQNTLGNIQDAGKAQLQEFITLQLTIHKGCAFVVGLYLSHADRLQFGD